MRKYSIDIKRLQAFLDGEGLQYGNVRALCQALVAQPKSNAGGIMLMHLLSWWPYQNKRKDGAVYRSSREWQEKEGVTYRQTLTAQPYLERVGVVVWVEKAHGIPTRHYRLDVARFMLALGQLTGVGIWRMGAYFADAVGGGSHEVIRILPSKQERKLHDVSADNAITAESLTIVTTKEKAIETTIEPHTPLFVDPVASGDGGGIYLSLTDGLIDDEDKRRWGHVIDQLCFQSKPLIYIWEQLELQGVEHVGELVTFRIVEPLAADWMRYIRIVERICSDIWGVSPSSVTIEPIKRAVVVPAWRKG